MISAGPPLVLVKQPAVFDRAGDIPDRIDLRYSFKGFQGKPDLRRNVDDIIIVCSGNSGASDDILTLRGNFKFVPILPFGSINPIR